MPENRIKSKKKKKLLARTQLLLSFYAQTREGQVVLWDVRKISDGYEDGRQVTLSLDYGFYIFSYFSPRIVNNNLDKSVLTLWTRYAYNFFFNFSFSLYNNLFENFYEKTTCTRALLNPSVRNFTDFITFSGSKSDIKLNQPDLFRHFLNNFLERFFTCLSNFNTETQVFYYFAPLP